MKTLNISETKEVIYITVDNQDYHRDNKRKKPNPTEETEYEKKIWQEYEKQAEKHLKKISFADPTYDITFKMLFANDEYKDILISFLNSLLGLKGESVIKNIRIENNNLNQTFNYGISNAVDVLCTDDERYKIAIEMQRYGHPSFFPREQEYMSKIISHQVKRGEGKEYDKKILKTYIIIIAKNDIFVEKSESESSKFWERDSYPTIHQTGKMYPQNKMYWKFFELSRFEKYVKNKDVKGTVDKVNLKFQWLNFLNNCGKAKSMPENVDEIIKKGYNIMKIAKWTPEQKILYWKHQQNVAATEAQLRKAKEIEEKLKEVEKKVEEEVKKGVEKGIEKGVIKTTIETVKNLLAKKIMDLKQIKKVFKNFDSKVVEYVATHLDDANETIYKDIIGQSSESINQNDTGEI
jgi:predicted transposase/invertase (TIGR01784 family)